MSSSTLIERAGRTREDREYLYHVRSGPCTYCVEQAEALDHIIPQAQGGICHWTNLAPVCHRCNSAKNQATPLGYLGARLDQDLRRWLADKAVEWRGVGR